MKIGYFCESPADQAAMAVFVEGILGEPPEPISMDLEAHGVGDVLTGLDAVLKGVHFNSDAEGLVIVVDCDKSPLHEPDHEPTSAENDRCRFCKCTKILSRVRKNLSPRQGRPELKVAIGLAVPAIEAWYLTGKNHKWARRAGKWA